MQGTAQDSRAWYNHMAQPTPIIYSARVQVFSGETASDCIMLEWALAGTCLEAIDLYQLPKAPETDRPKSGFWSNYVGKQVRPNQRLWSFKVTTDSYSTDSCAVTYDQTNHPAGRKVVKVRGGDSGCFSLKELYKAKSIKNQPNRVRPEPYQSNQSL